MTPDPAEGAPHLAMDARSGRRYHCQKAPHPPGGAPPCPGSPGWHSSTPAKTESRPSIALRMPYGTMRLRKPHRRINSRGRTELWSPTRAATRQGKGGMWAAMRVRLPPDSPQGRVTREPGVCLVKNHPTQCIVFILLFHIDIELVTRAKRILSP